ncbi:MAG: adenine deaminase [Opitutaceae bacterium]|nr:adenine deaminase [Opitutaceae bacterium]
MKTPAQRLAGQIVDLHRRRIFPGVVEWAGGRIVRIREDKSVRAKHFIAPGFVDAHIHIESSMLPPAEFARWAVVHGTVATVSDPHEIANVLGVAGVDHMIRDGRRTPFKFHFGAPSCVPATTFETAGASLDARAVAKLLARPEIKYLSEVMNFPGVLARDPSLMAMIAAAKKRGKPVDGHAPGLRGKTAARYAAAGITTDHECFTLPEARDKLAAGMKILIREGSAARNFAALEPLLRADAASCMFCCDDLHPDLLMVRHLDEHVRRAIRGGADLFDVLRCASVNPVEHYKLDVGLLRTGDPADFIVFEGWENLKVRRTYLRGGLVARDGRSLLPRQPSKTPNVFRARLREVEDFAVACRGADLLRPSGMRVKGRSKTAPLQMNVIEALNGQLITRHLRAAPRVVGRNVVADPSRDILKIAVVNRYGPGGPLLNKQGLSEIAVAFIKGFGLKAGAIASSVAHDSHNVVAVGADDASLCAAVNLVIKARGGISVVGRGRRAVLPLPIAGLMSDQDGRAVARRYTALDAAAKRLGSKLDAPFMTLSFMALLVIPDLKLSDRGLFSAAQWGFVPVQGG